MKLKMRNVVLTALSLFAMPALAEKKNPVVLYESELIQKKNIVDVSANVDGLKKFYLVLTDGDGDISRDHGMVIDAKLTGSNGEISLNGKWTSAKSSWGIIEVGKNPEGKTLQLPNKKKVTNGFGVHAHAVIEFAVPDGYNKFTAQVGLARSSKYQGSIKAIVAKNPIAQQQGITSLPTESFKTMDDLEVTVWAKSPMFYNPTNMDIDSKGRIWVAEGVNYRNFRQPIMDVKHPKGDRIMVLEDKDGDGQADSSHVFVQEKELHAPLGVAVIGNKVIVSQPPSLIMYTDVDGDARFNPEVDKKEKFLTGFTGFTGLDHDHSLHSVTFGPDGEYYFNQGNAGFSQVTDKSGKTYRVGSSYRGGSPHLTSNTPGAVSDDGFVYVGGFAARVKPDGTGLTIIGHNFRNSYEQTVSSYGDVFQNDNDDPPACRTTWLMEYGNAGFASADGKRTWRADQRPGQSVPVAEWRQEDPGTIPAGDIYGGGSPTGIVLYENGALGDKYNGMLLSCEAARSVIFGYFPKPQQAGFALDRFDTSIAKKNRNWFRPSDVSVGADGAIYVADWFDPGVGGHRMSDRTGSGTIYRIAPKGFKPHNPKFDVNTTAGMIKALKSPAPNVRAIGFIKLKEQGAASIPALKELLKDKNHFIAARAVWLLAQINDKGRSVVEGLLSHNNPQTRIVAYRALRRENHKFMAISNRMAVDSSSAVRREVALAMRNLSLQDSKDILLKIAEQYDGKDPWYLEAFGTGCAKKEQEMYAIVHAKLSSSALKWSKPFADIAWRLHPETALQDFATCVMSTEISYDERKRGLTAIGFMKSKEAAETMLTAALSGPKDLQDTAAWWVKNKSNNDWSAYKLDGKLKTKKAASTFDLSKHLTKDNGTLPTI